MAKALLVILDGFSYGRDDKGNALLSAKTPHLDELRRGIFTELDSHAQAVGLPDGQMGNSEVGHMNIGAGRVILQDYMRINEDIKSGEFQKNPAFQKAIEHAQNNNGRVHLMGLLGPGGVHAHHNHWKAAMKLTNLPVILHPILDGRDTPPKSASEFLRVLNKDKPENAKIAGVVGRYYAMDRDNRWERTKLAYDFFTQETGKKVSSVDEASSLCYEESSDEFCEPILIEEGTAVREGDSVIWLNFRPDRSRQMTRAFMQPEVLEFDRKKIENVCWVCMTQYDDEFLDYPNLLVAYPKQKIDNTLAEIISQNNLRQLHIAETEKYAHVTYFINGGKEEPFPGEERLLIPSPKVATYDIQPEMSAYSITEKLVEAIDSCKFEFIVVNYANPDMVGHTGDFSATVKALEAVDYCLGKLMAACKENKYVLCLTSDHGNSEEMLDKRGNPITAHTLGKSPFAVFNGPDITLKKGTLAHIAPTILKLLEIDRPPEMIESLF